MNKSLQVSQAACYWYLDVIHEEDCADYIIKRFSPSFLLSFLHLSNKARDDAVCNNCVYQLRWQIVQVQVWF